jgi:preprotein translocase subunit SecG
MSEVVLWVLLALFFISLLAIGIVVKRKIRISDSKREQLKQLREMKKQGFLTADEFKKIQTLISS